MLLRGFLKLARRIIVNEEVLGSSFSSKIGGIDVIISFPQFNTKHRDDYTEYVGIYNPLIAPKVVTNWKQGVESLEWGYPITYPEITASVRLITISINCDLSHEDEIASTIYTNIKKWEKSFLDYCFVSTRQYLSGVSYIDDEFSDFDLYDSKYIAKERSVTIHVSLPDNSHSISIAVIKKACEFASSNQELFLEYQMMLSAYSALVNLKNRQAVIDACAALEICLNKVICNYCNNKDIPKEILLNQYRFLAAKVDLIKKLYPSQNLPNDTKTKVITIRNGIAHSIPLRMNPTNEETIHLIDCVNEWLDIFYTGYYNNEGDK